MKEKQVRKVLQTIYNQESDEIELSRKDFDLIVDTLTSVMIKENLKNDQIQGFLRVFSGLLKELTDAIVRNVQQGQEGMNIRIFQLFSMILQYTNELNYMILEFYVNLQQNFSLFNLTNDLKLLLECIFRHVEAQPYLKEVWNCSQIFNQQLGEGIQYQQQVETQYLLIFLRQLINPTQQLNQQLTSTTTDSLQTLKNLEYIDSLRLNKEEEAQKQAYYDQLLSGPLVITYDDNNTIQQASSTRMKVMTKYLESKITTVEKEMNEKIFQHFVVYGDEGSGKMSFIELLSHSFHQSERYIVVTLEETFDAKNLVGTYVCNEIGEFIFKKGPLTVAAENGLWLIVRNIEKAPSDLLSFLLPLVQDNELHVTSAFKLVPKLGFRIFALCQSNNQTHSHEDIQPFLSHLSSVELDKIDSRQDFEEILRKQYQYVYNIEWLPSLLIKSIYFLNTQFNHFKSHLLDYKQFSIRQLFKLFKRVDKIIQKNYSGSSSQMVADSFYMASGMRQHLLEEISDIFLGYLYDKEIKEKLIQNLVKEVWNEQEGSQGNLDPQNVSDHVLNSNREYALNTSQCYFGRSDPIAIQQKKPQADDDDVEMSSNTPQIAQRKFVYTSQTLRTMEQITSALQSNESMLLVGETGTGKTTSVQELARILGKTLHVFNMNQNTDSADLLGGFKPVDLKFLLRPIYEHFLYVFKGEFKKIEKNQKFLDLIQKCYEENKIKEFIQCLQHGHTAIKGKKSLALPQEDVQRLENQIIDLQKRSAKLESGGGFIFQFIEGTLIKSIQNGEWVLLDEINLASESLLNRISTIIDGEYIMLNERADVIETTRNKDFRLFLCMNPPYTSAGKKQLPWSLRSKLTEIYVPELENQNDLWMIIDKNCSHSISETHKRQILDFYMKIRDLVIKQTKRGNIGLRNLSRALSFMKSAISLKYPMIKAIYDSLYTCFASHLDASLQKQVSQLIFKLFEIRQMPQLSTQQESNLSDKFVCVEQFIIPRGGHKNDKFDEKDFVITSSFKRLLKQLAGIVAVSDYAVILQGPTSAGKTSTVQYLANVTHNKVIRINNHMHTDIQEYLGSYVPDKSGGGKLVFQEGVLVEAVRNGYWVILDELNLAPSEVLEALNRLLDDNRELLIVETQKIIKAHPNFRIFATQNPTEGYGGRKELSEAFKNRFILINVHEVPLDELIEILIHKCSLPKSRAELMVKVMEQLQIYRSQGNVFGGKESTITVRDLLKWAKRLEMKMTMQDLAMEGYLVLAERSRNEQDKHFIRQTIEKVCNTKLDPIAYYNQYFEKNLKGVFDTVPSQIKMQRLIQSQQLKRLATLVHKCLMNQEPVLLVGETGCGKTSLCQVFAALRNQMLYSINCHQNTETSDFIGCMRTRKNLKQTQDMFTERYNEVAQQMRLKGVIKEEQHGEMMKCSSIKKRYTLMQSVAKGMKGNEGEFKKPLQELKTLYQDLSCIFEWHDGILVESMEKGGLLLIDEISLANDSVLERLNSVFEADRTLVISEKSSTEAVRIIGHPMFNIVATMNPSGDFGKKELSPALRNRMTEIWVESYFNQKELRDIYQGHYELDFVALDVDFEVDLYRIIYETSKDKFPQLKPDNVKQISLGIFNMIGYINFIMSAKYFSLQRKALSIRDILSMIEFISVTTQNGVFNQQHSSAFIHSFRHSLELVIIDGLCLGIDISGEKQKREIIQQCEDYIRKLEMAIFKYEKEAENEMKFIDSKTNIGVQPFLLPKLKNSSNDTHSYAFDAETTKVNLLKLIRAYQLNKPILIEGPPGVGKTSLIENLARVSGRKLIRVNLSEQTDMMDLLGSEYPTVAHNGGSNDSSTNDDAEEEEIRFHWCDGVLLRAIKEGNWFLIDEMNLAQQSVLEGLNAILDHRRTVYIPELNQEFQCHENFFVFACQNPSSSATSAVGGRKTLPKSFLNRFNKIYLEELNSDDYKCIIERQIANQSTIRDLDVEKLLQLSHDIELLIKSDNNLYQDEGAINMRDLIRFLKLYSQFISEISTQNLEEFNIQKEKCLRYAFEIGYIERIKNKTQQEKAIEIFFNSGIIQQIQNFKAPEAQLVRVANNNTIKFQNPLKNTIITAKNEHTLQYSMKQSEYLDLKGLHSKQLQHIIDCLNTNIPLLVMTNNPQRLVQNIQVVAKVIHQRVNRILLNEKSDTSQLLGCFEQTSQDISSFLQKLNDMKGQMNDQQILLLLEFNDQIRKTQNIDQQLSMCKQIINMDGIFKHLEGELREIEKSLRSGSSRFEWVDSVLIQSIVKGEWVIFENANLCNPSILDRLNPLLEEGNQTLSINEQGLVDNDQIREVKAHQDFRSIFVISQHTLVDQGRDVSRALRNRCLQLNVIYDDNDKFTFDNQCGDEINIIDIRYSQMINDIEIYRQKDDKDKIQTFFDQEFISQLGKRKQRDTECINQLKLVSGLNLTQLQKYFTSSTAVDKSYQHFETAYLIYLIKEISKMENDDTLLQYLIQQFKDSTLIQFINKNINFDITSWNNYLRYLLKQDINAIDKLLTASSKKLILNKHSQRFLQTIINHEFETDDLINAIILIRSLHKQLQDSDFHIINYQNLYIATRYINNLNIQEIIIGSGDGQDQINQILLRKNQDLISSVRQIHSYGQNPISSHRLKNIRDEIQKINEVRQEPIQICVKDIKNRDLLYSIGSQALLLCFNVIIMDENKTIIRMKKENLDPYLIQEKLNTPYLITIPYQPNLFLISTSELYTPVCLLKDLISLKYSNKKNQLTKRMTSIPVITEDLKNQSLQNFVIRNLLSTNIETLYGNEPNTFEQTLITKILDQEHLVSFRELPAQIIVNNSISKQLQKYIAHQKANSDNVYSYRDVISGNDQVNFTIADSDIVSGSLTVSSLKQQLTAQLGKVPDSKTSIILDNITTSMAVMNQINIQEVLESLFIIPLEIFRLNKLKKYELYQYQTQVKFLVYHLRSQKEAKEQSQAIEKGIEEIAKLIEQYSQIKLSQKATAQLKSLILYVKELSDTYSELSHRLIQEPSSIVDNKQFLIDKIRLIYRILIKGIDQYFLEFNNFLAVYFATLFTFTHNLQLFIHQVTVKQSAVLDVVIQFKSNHNYMEYLRECVNAAQSSQIQLLYEYQLKFLLKYKRIKNEPLRKDQQTYILDYFVRREIAKKIKEQQDMEDLEELTYRLPFKMKVQSLMENNKAIDERTKKDKEDMEKEAKLEIERNFPSYFDEFQRTIFSGVVAMTQRERRQKHEVKYNSIISELLELQNAQRVDYKKSTIRLRLKIIEQYFKEEKTVKEIGVELLERECEWMHDARNYLREESVMNATPSVMNVSDVFLNETYNFYHDPLPIEARLVYDPLLKLLIRINEIIEEYETPILNDAMFLANYMLATMSPKTTPLMKILTGLELLLSKLEEWEVYAARNINSCQDQMTLLKQLIIRYRKIQILSWRNLLTWKKHKMIKEDFENMLRLAHTIERQVMDKEYYKKNEKKGEIENKIFEVLDLFMRDSSLGQYISRLRFMKILLNGFKAKSNITSDSILRKIKMTEQMTDRLNSVINILEFVLKYYGQFEEKLQNTIKRLDNDAREKVKTLIDVSKWTVQKFQQVKNNIDKRHKQLNRAIQLEEEVLIQNITSLILTSSRKKYIKKDDHLIGLECEKTKILQNGALNGQIKIENISNWIALPTSTSTTILTQLRFIEKKYIEEKFPDCFVIESTINDMFERMKIVRDTNKKHIQRRAFIDLLKFLKDQGLSHNFQQKIMPLIMETRIKNTFDDGFQKYFFKAHELMLMLENSSQVDENSDLRNVDIIRIRGFSQSLLFKILQINKDFNSMMKYHKSLSKITHQITRVYSKHDQMLQICSDKQNKKYQVLIKRSRTVYENLIEKLRILDLLENNNVSANLMKIDFGDFNNDFVSPLGINLIKETVSQLILNLDQLVIQTQTLSRHQRVINEQKNLLSELLQEFTEMSLSTDIDMEQQDDNEKFTKRVNLLQKKVQVFYQDIVKQLETLHQSLRKDSIADTMISNNDDHSHHDQAPVNNEEDEGIDLSVKESQEFVEKLNKECIGKHLTEITDFATKIFAFKGIKTPLSEDQLSELQRAGQIIEKTKNTVDFILKNLYSYMRSLAKFSYISQRVFVYLIFEGFCGQDDQDQEQKDQEQQDDDKFFETEGMGMGDGQGGKENVSNQIEHEEQVEGLKNYESEDEQQKQEEKQDQQEEEEEQDNNFEMEGDFDAELEDKPDNEKDEEDKKDEEDNEDDQLDKVDDLLDNQLWNQNMEDLEDKQEEDEKNDDKEDKEKEEVDLGERELDKENQLKNQEKEVKAGDHDKQEKDQDNAKNEDNQENQEPNQDEDQEMDDQDPDEEGEQDKDEEQSEIPLDRESNVAEEEKKEGDVDDDQESHSEDDEGKDQDGEKEEEKDIDEKFEDENNDKDMNDDQDMKDQDSQGEDENEQVKKDFNKEILEQDKIQSLEKEKQKENQQSNLKKNQSNNMNQQKQSNKNEQRNQQMEQQTQFDVDGSDILYQLSQQMQQKEKKQQEQNYKDQKQEQQDPLKKQIEDPQMNPEQNQQQQQQQQENKNDHNDQDAMEYEFDQEAEQLQGKLATDKVEESKMKQQNDELKDDVMEVDEDNDDLNRNQGDIQKTEQQILNSDMKQPVEREQDSNQEGQKLKENQQIITLNQEEQEKQLIDEYQSYLEQKRLMNLNFEEEKQPSQMPDPTTFAYDLERFDYNENKMLIRELFNNWMQNSQEYQNSQMLLNKFKQNTLNSSASLCEQLRIVLEPQLSQQLQGDYKTGKRLNMKKVISFIASRYRNDKIWLRRTMPSKRDYKILVAIDDTLSMKENNLGFFSLEALVTIMEALNRLEVGKVAVAAIRDRLQLLQSFEDSYSNERTSFIISQFDFTFSASKSADYAMANFVRDSCQMLDTQNSGAAGGLNCPIVIILSDGRFNKNNVRPYLNQAKDKKYLYIFVILDNVKETTDKKQSDGSILSMKSVEKSENGSGGIKLVPYLKDFPFEYYCIVRDTHQLPSALGSILVQWFSLMSGGSHK